MLQRMLSSFPFCSLKEDISCLLRAKERLRERLSWWIIYTVVLRRGLCRMLYRKHIYNMAIYILLCGVGVHVGACVSVCVGVRVSGRARVCVCGNRQVCVCIWVRVSACAC